MVEYINGLSGDLLKPIMKIPASEECICGLVVGPECGTAWTSTLGLGDPCPATGSRETPRDQLPRQLGEIHILPSDGLFDATRDLDTLSATLEADREWLKEHTRLADRAREWVGRSHSKALLLRGAALKAGGILAVRALPQNPRRMTFTT